MSNIVLINGSPKSINDTSGHLLKQVFGKLDNKKLVINIDIQGRRLSKEEKLNIIGECDILVLASPIYMGTVPSIVCEFLEEVEEYLKNNISKEKKIYGIVNCGSISGKEGKLGLKVMQNFAERIENITYAGGIGIGGIGFFGIKSKGIYAEKNIEDTKLEKLIEKINKEKILDKNIYSKFTDKKLKRKNNRIIDILKKMIY